MMAAYSFKRFAKKAIFVQPDCILSLHSLNYIPRFCKIMLCQTKTLFASAAAVPNKAPLFKIIVMIFIIKLRAYIDPAKYSSRSGRIRALLSERSEQGAVNSAGNCTQRLCIKFCTMILRFNLNRTAPWRKLPRSEFDEITAQHRLQKFPSAVLIRGKRICCLI